jgi:hypothetical protein
MALIGIAPLTMVRTEAGRTEYVYAGAPAPAGILDEDADRLVAEGFLVEVDDQVLDEAVVVVPDGSVGPGVTAIRPANVANKAAWLDYRVALGHLTPEQRAAVETEQLELTVANLKDDAFMDDWATSPASTPAQP